MAHILNCPCLNMASDQAEPFRIIPVRSIIKQDQVKVRLFFIEFSEILWETDLKADSDTYFQRICQNHSQVSSFGKNIPVPAP